MTTPRIAGSVGREGMNIPKDVSTVQTLLKEKGFYKGKARGFYTHEVADSIKKFQTRFMKEPDGVIKPHSIVWFKLIGLVPVDLPLPAKPKNEYALTLGLLQGFVGKTMGDICNNAFTNPNENHCAHFVSHVLNIQLGLLCSKMLWDTRKNHGVSLRCDELYNGLALRGKWEDKPAFADGLLIFVISAAKVRNGRMGDHRRKHVGIHFGGKVFHFSNGQGKVIVDPTVDEFHNKFKHSYRVDGNDISLFFGVAP